MEDKKITKIYTHTDHDGPLIFKSAIVYEDGTESSIYDPNPDDRNRSLYELQVPDDGSRIVGFYGQDVGHAIYHLGFIVARYYH